MEFSADRRVAVAVKQAHALIANHLKLRQNSPKTKAKVCAMEEGRSEIGCREIAAGNFMRCAQS